MWFAGWLWYHAKWMEMVVFGWVVLERTDSPGLVALVGFCRLVPMPSLGLMAGIVADRINRKGVIIAAQVVNIICVMVLFLLLLAQVAQVWHIALVALVMGTAWTMDFAARRPMIMDMVGSGRLANAMSTDATAMTGSKMMGPIFGGLLLAFASGAAAMFALMLLYIGGFVLMLRIHSPEENRRMDHEPPLRMLREGLAYVLTNPLLLAVLLITVVVNFCLIPVMVMVPVFARDVLSVGPALMGILAAADGLGALAGALFLASRVEMLSQGRIFAYGSTGALLFVLGFSVSGVYGLSLVLLVLAGVCIAGFVVMQTTIMLLASPEAMRGRALGEMMVAIGAGPLGVLITGAGAEAWGAPTAIFINCLVCLAVMGGILLKIPAIRRSVTFV